MSYYSCSQCGDVVSVPYKYNGASMCKKCFDAVCPSKLDMKNLPKFYTSKDKLWEFVDVHTTGRPIQFTSKRQWKAHIKSLGLHDDIKQSRTESEISNSFDRGRQFKKTPREEIKREIWNELKSKGLNDRLIRR